MTIFEIIILTDILPQLWKMRNADMHIRNLFCKSLMFSKVLLHCQDLAPSLNPYKESFEGVIGETEFRDSMLRLSLDPEANCIKDAHRERVVPLILRVLFSKLVKKSKKLDKKGNQKHSRRAAVFSAFASLQEGELHHMLAIVLQGVLSFRKYDASNPSSIATGSKLSEIPRARMLTKFLAAIYSGEQVEKVWSDEKNENDVPVGFTYLWKVDENRTLAVSLDDTARIRRLIGFLNSSKDMLINMSHEVSPILDLLMSLFVTILQRSPAAALASSVDEKEEKNEDEENSEETKIMGASSHRMVVRETLRRMTEITTKYPIPISATSWESTLAPIKPTVEMLIARLPTTSGCVQMSAVVNMFIQWSHHPELFCLFALFPTAIPTLLSLFSAPAVLHECKTVKQQDASSMQIARRKAKQDGKRALKNFDHQQVKTPSAGPVVEEVIDMVMRLSKGCQEEIKNLKKQEKKYKDIRRQQKRKAKFHRDSSSEDEEMDKTNFITNEEIEAWTQGGLNLVQPHADLMLKNISIMIQHRKDNIPAAPICTIKELDLLETIAVWADSQESNLALTKLLCMALLQRPKAKTNNRTDKQLSALISLVPKACLIAGGDVSKVDDDVKEIMMLPRQLDRLLPHAQHLSCRKQICEIVLLSEMALRGEVIAQNEKMDHNELWQPSANPVVDSTTYTEVHVAHIMMALNALRPGLAVSEPDTDAHVMMLEAFSDTCCGESNPLPAKLLGPVLSHVLFLMANDSIDFAVRNSAERVLTSIADRILTNKEDVFKPRPEEGGFATDAAELFHLLLHRVIPGIRKNLKLENEDVQRSNLKVLSHFTRMLGPICPAVDTSDESVFGNSPAGLLHADLLPFLRDNVHAASADEGGDLFHELLHLQKHRRGRAIMRAAKLISKGNLSRPTVVHVIQPICVSMVLQLSSSKQNFDANLAEQALRCLGSVCQAVQWSTILVMLRYLSGILFRRKDRETYVVKTICHILQSYRYNVPDAVSKSAEAVLAEVEKNRDHQAEEEGLFPGEKSSNDAKRVEEDKAAREAARKAAKEEGEAVEEDDQEDEEVAEAMADLEAKKLEDQREIVARSVKSVVLPILRKILWEKDKEAAEKASIHIESQGGRRRRREPTGTIRVGVVSVMLHVLRFLPAEQFHGQLPRLVHVLTEGLLSRDAGQRRAARFASSHVVTALGSAYFPWLIKEMKPRMTRGYAIPVLMMTAHTCLEALVNDSSCLSSDSLQSDIDTATYQLMPLVEKEVERLCDPSRMDGDSEDRLPNQVNESKGVRGPVMLRMLCKYASPRLVQEEVVQTLYSWLLKDRTSGGENWGQVSTNATSLKFLRKVDELIRSSIDGLLTNNCFDITAQVSVMERLLKLTAQLLNPKKFGNADDEAMFKIHRPKFEEKEFEVGAKGWVPPRKEATMKVQPGAAQGRGAWHGKDKKKNQHGFDAQARARVLGTSGLRILLRTMRHDELESVKPKLSTDIVPLVAACFTGSQDALFISSSKCLHRLLVIYHEQPEVFEPYAEKIAVTVLNVFRRAAAQQQLSARLQRQATQRGLGVAGGNDLIGTCTKTLATLLRKKISSDWFSRVHDKQLKEIEDVDQSIAKSALKTTFIEALIGQIHSSLDHEALRPSSLLLLSRVLLRQRVELPSIYECVDRVGEMLIRGGDTHTSKRCAQIYTEFMLDYPHEDKALQNKLTFLIRNLGYNEEGGRRSVLNALYMIIMQFPIDLLTKRFGALIFVPLAARLPQENDDQCRKMLEVLLIALLERVDKSTRNQLLSLALKWKTSDKKLLKIALADLLSIVPQIEGEKHLERFQQFVPVLRELLPEEVGPVNMQKDAVEWRLVYSVSKAFENFCSSITPNDLDRLSKHSTCGEATTSFWSELVGGALVKHPHPWVRAVSLRTLQNYVTSRDATTMKKDSTTLVARSWQCSKTFENI